MDIGRFTIGISGAGHSIAALMLREMATVYGRSSIGYVWALLEPVLGIALLSAIFALAFNAPPLGVSFPLFYASGLLPLVLFLDVTQKTGQSLRFSRAMMRYPGVALMDAVAARLVLAMLTQIVVALIALGVLVGASDVDELGLIRSYFGLFLLASGVGVFNCWLGQLYPLWLRLWAVLSKPLFVLSGVFFLIDDVADPFRDWLMWNPMTHVIAMLRGAIYPYYTAQLASAGYVAFVGALALVIGLCGLAAKGKGLADAGG